MSLAQRVEQIEARIAAACERSSRNVKDVSIVAVTKYVPLEAVREILEFGFEHVGENRWQDAQEKWNELGERGTWHFIGHLQTNKVKDVVGKFAYIHSLDRLSLAQELNKKAGALGIKARCFLQVNVSGEESKYGLSPDELFPFVETLKNMEHLQIEGLMTMAPYEAEPESTRPVFRGLRELRDKLNEAQILDYEVVHLSMGMSNDFEIAIEEGATWVRLGSVLTS